MCEQGFVEIEDKAAKQAEEEEIDDEEWTDLERFQVFHVTCFNAHSVERYDCTLMRP